MKRFLKIHTVLILLGVLVVGNTTGWSITTNVATTAGQFLKIGVGTRATAMGEAFVAVANDASALYWNPAGLGLLKHREFLFTQTKWIADIQYSFLGAVMPLKGRGTIGGYIAYLGSGEMPVRTEESPEGTGETFMVQDLAVAVVYGVPFTDRFSFGMAFKYIGEKIWHMQAGTFGVDIGIHFKTYLKGINIGMNFANFGGKMRLMGEDTRFIYNIDPERDPNSTPNVVADLRTESFQLPMRFQVGLSGPLPRLFASSLLRGIWAVDFITPNDNTPYFNVGTELYVGPFLTLRLGHRWIFLTDREGGFTAGLGFQAYKPKSPWKLYLDYSYLGVGRLQEAHRFGLRMQF